MVTRGKEVLLPVRGVNYAVHVYDNSESVTAECLDIQVSATCASEEEALNRLRIALEFHRSCLRCGEGQRHEATHESTLDIINAARWHAERRDWPRVCQLLNEAKRHEEERQ